MAEKLNGTVERIVFRNPENGYTVFRLKPGSASSTSWIHSGMVTVTGIFPELSKGESLVLSGNWANHPKHGLQFQTEEFQQEIPTTVDGIRGYLGSGLIKGIGERLADNIVNHFGPDTIEVIENQPDRLLEVPDIGEKRAQIIATAWQKQKDIKQIMIFLHGQNISTSHAVKIYKQYGKQALHIVMNDPYRLAADIHGIGFKTADEIAQKTGLSPEHPSRIEAGIEYILAQSSTEGNVFTPQERLTKSALELLQVPSDHIPPALQRLKTHRRIHLEGLPAPGSTAPSKTSPGKEIEGINAVYPVRLYESELETASRLTALAGQIPTRLSDLPPAFLAIDPALSADQKTAVLAAVSSPVCILTGGPGTGKTTTLKSLIEVLDSARKSYALASPTGRAAKRLSQATGKPASTIHRLLGFSPGEGFRHNAENPLDIDMLVIDEASMLDIILTSQLLRALTPGTHLLLVGDSDQLPSVGPGDVLRSIIDSGTAKVCHLQEIFRQAANSYIITNAHQINRGIMPDFPTKGQDNDRQPVDFYLFPADTPETAASWISDLVCTRIPRQFGLNGKADIQVLSPIYRGAAGVDMLNKTLQSWLNPQSPGCPQQVFSSRTFRVGDRLMQIRNDYDKGVFNGDIGQLIDLDLVEQTITVDIDGRPVVYDWDEADQLVHAYAITVHKSQGSEFPAVVLPVIPQHYIMLQRNLLYTAITRARQLCVLVGNQRAIEIAVRNNKVAQRYTGLEHRLRTVQT